YVVTQNSSTGWNLSNRLPSRRLNVVYLQRTLTPEGFSGEEPPMLKSVCIQSILKSNRMIVLKKKGSPPLYRGEIPDLGLPGSDELSALTARPYAPNACVRGN
ncbi:Unknown protein, partial [Striga hermonthica]